MKKLTSFIITCDTLLRYVSCDYPDVDIFIAGDLFVEN